METSEHDLSDKKNMSKHLYFRLHNEVTVPESSANKRLAGASDSQSSVRS